MCLPFNQSLGASRNSSYGSSLFYTYVENACGWWDEAWWAIGHGEGVSCLLLRVQAVAMAVGVSSDYPQVIVQSPDTDVALICVQCYDMPQTLVSHWSEEQTTLHTYPWYSVSHRSRRIQAPSLHTLTGCDSTSALSGIGKKTVFRQLLKASQLYNFFYTFTRSRHWPCCSFCLGLWFFFI